MKRRSFLKGSLGASAMAVAVGAGLLNPRQALAAWPKAAFDAKSVPDALNDLVGTGSTTPSSDITIKAPDIAENGAVVPVTISTSLPSVASISIFAEKNTNPLAASFDMASNAKGFVSTRIKMAKTAHVVAAVKSGGKVYAARKEVKVTIGGCGG